MRLHRLEVTAFGPFAGTVAVDFDELGASGLFLLTGPTGAGKSSVLDAVCFALYGEVPGDRQQARHLRSDHAAEGVAPEVALTASITGRTFRFTRSPGWERPKRRGAGTTRQQPRVLIEECVGGEWTGLATRLDDAGLFVSSLLGMTCAQFTQVAMLPQGRFQAFLRASSSERHGVLQRLFRTDRFERVEQWLVQHRLELRRDSDALGAAVAGKIHRLQEAGTATVPEEWDLDDLDGAAERGEIRAWSAEVALSADTAYHRAAVAHAAATEDATAAEAAYAEARTAAGLRAEATAAHAALAALAEDAAASDQLKEALGRHQRATRAEPAARAVVESEAAVSRGAAEVARVAAELGIDASSGSQDTRPALARAETRHAELKALLPRVTALDLRRHELEAADHDLTQDRLAHSVAATAVADLPERLCVVEADERAACAAAADADAAAEGLARARAGAAAAAEVVRLEQELAQGRLALVVATEKAQQGREAYLDAREARITAIASELAGALVSGCSCPVCGSVEHPTPAASGGPASRDVEEAARRSYEDAETERMALQEAQAARAARTDTLRDAAGGRSAAEWADVVENLLARTARAADAAATAMSLADERESLQRELKQATRELSVLEVAVARGEERCTQLRSAADALAEELAGVDLELDEVPVAVAATERLADQLRRLCAAQDRIAVLREAHRSARTRAEASCASAGFIDSAEALAAVLAPEKATAIAAALEERADRERAARATLARPDVTAALSDPAPDVEALQAAAARTSSGRDGSAATLLDRERARTRTDRLAGELASALDRWAPAREAAALAASLAAFVEGKGPDNPLRMRLSAYVLAERLRQVVAAANGRLATMSGQRYTLEQADERGAGDRRGGLSLRVRDEWTGALRDPVTLSGGETFVVSLALALGLADTVSHEAGGTDIDTLFIDEGFGSLDSETLEEVMDTLDSLREGGRTVGLVSHVPELRERITARLEVRKARAGSTLVAS